MSFGAGLVMWGVRRRPPPLSARGCARPAFYALAPGGWRDLVTLLHPPYTAWHLSYVALGAAAAPDDPRQPARRRPRRVLPGRRDRRPRAGRAARTAAADPAEPRARSSPWPSVSLAGAVAIGVVGTPSPISAWLVPLVVRRRVPGGRLQPRAVRRPRARRHVVRAGLGRLPRLHRLLRQRAQVRPAGSAGGGRVHAAQRRPAPAEHAGAGAAAPHRATITGTQTLTTGETRAARRPDRSPSRSSARSRPCGSRWSSWPSASWPSGSSAPGRCRRARARALGRWR